MQTGTCPSDQMSMPMVNGNNVPISGIPPPVMIQQQQQQQQVNSNPGQHQILNPTAISQGQLPIVPDGTQQFCLRWNSYPATVATQLAILRASEDFVDVTLACEGRQLRAHKLVLAACSPYFMELFKSTPCKHPVIFLRDVGFRQLVALLEFMYAGEVNVSQTELPTLLRTAEALQVRGLADTNTNNNSINDNNNYQQQIPPKNQIFNPPQQQYPTPPVMVQQQHQGFSPVSTQSDPTSAVPQQQTTAIPSQPQATVTNQAQHQLDNLQQQQQQSSDTAMQSTSSISSNQFKSHKRRKSSMSSQACRDAEDFSSDSNYSPETFTELKPASKSENIEHTMNLPSNLNSTANPIEMTNSSNRATGSIGQAEQNRQDSLMEFDGIGNLGGSQSEEETSEEEELDDDEDDGEIKEFSDGSYNLDPNDEGDTGIIPGTSDGNSGAAPLGIKNPELGSKDEAAIADKVQRSRLSRSLWPPGLPYHGPQQCPYCPRVLSNVGNWRKHVVTMHFAREKTYKCKHCNSSFRTAEYLQKHYVRVHNYAPKMTRKKHVEQT